MSFNVGYRGIVCVGSSARDPGGVDNGNGN